MKRVYTADDFVKNPKKYAKGKCSVCRCGRKIQEKNIFCAKHIHIRRKVLDPVGYTYNFFKQNAKRRGKSFEITLEEFRRWCTETGYMDTKGKTKSCSSIDRIDSSKGYSINNIQILTVSENSSKQNRDIQGDDCPF